MLLIGRVDQLSSRASWQQSRRCLSILTAARLYAQIEADLATAGAPVDRSDLQIAATAMARGWSVATLNRADFARVPGLGVIGLE